jgi:hypothetical protein
MGLLPTAPASWSLDQDGLGTQLEAAQKLRGSATSAGIPETTLNLQGLAGLWGREG